MRKPQRYWLIAEWVGPIEPEPARADPGANVDVPLHSQKVNFVPAQKSVHTLPTPINRGRKLLYPGVDITPHAIETPHPHRLSADCLV